MESSASLKLSFREFSQTKSHPAQNYVDKKSCSSDSARFKIIFREFNQSKSYLVALLSVQPNNYTSLGINWETSVKYNWHPQATNTLKTLAI